MSNKKSLEKISTDSFFIESLKRLVQSEKYRMINHSRVGARLMLKNNNQKRVFCPITAVCFELTGIYYPPKEVAYAVESVGLNSKQVNIIVKANDALKYVPIGSLPRLFANAIAN
jgi:hypothetical protein